jgi:hypothetical protein
VKIAKIQTKTIIATIAKLAQTQSMVAVIVLIAETTQTRLVLQTDWDALISNCIKITIAALTA